MNIQRRMLLLLTAAAVPVPAPARARPDLPRKLRIVVGFPGGGPLDIAARTIAPALASRLGNEVVVENHPGASGNIATEAVIRSAPDGSTLLLCGPVNTINASLFPDLAFDFVRDIAPVASIARVPLVVEVHPSVPVRTVPELLARARAHPGALRIAFAGIGTPQHVGIELFQHMAGVRLTLVPYPGSAAALDDLLQGKVDMMFDPAPSSMPHVKAGRLIPLATTGPERAAMLPEVPAMAEFLPGYEAGSWFGLGVPRQTPVDVIERLNAAVNTVLADPAVIARFAELGASTMGGGAAAFAAFIQAETEKYRAIIRIAGIRPA